ncbi:hypothetical protein [Bacillus cereus]|uniref:hypothetical protein n=1 Tax=Bacillus cereus TaxID=1396 RepID=UPI001952E34B|nr:hypothetical protein [Bacillus cereus]
MTFTNLGIDYRTKITFGDGGQFVATEHSRDKNKLVGYVAHQLSKEQALKLAELLRQYGEGC